MIDVADERPFAGLKVLDLTQGVAGPYATMLLALNGADVTKLEPLEGDWARRLGAAAGDQSVNFIAYNRAKRSLSIDLKSDRGRGVLGAALARCDIVVESFRPGVASKLGASYETAASARPDTIYLSISGFGQTGPEASRPAVDSLIQAYSGMMRMNETAQGAPHRSGMIVVDAVTGLFAYQTLCAAIVRRLRFGKGGRLEVSMVQATAAFQTAKIMEFAQSGGANEPLYVPAGMFETADGHICISGMRKEHFDGICRVTGYLELIDDPRWPTQADRIRHGDEINAKFRTAFRQATSAEWLRRLSDVGVMAERVRSYGEWLDEAHTRFHDLCPAVDTGRFGTLPIARVPGILPFDQPAREDQHAPALGEHSPEVLAEWGFDPSWVRRGIDEGIVRCSDAASTRS